MASKDELRKQQRTLARRPRANAPSYTMDATGELNLVSTNKMETKEAPAQIETPAASPLVTPVIEKIEEPKVIQEEKTENLVEEEPVAHQTKEEKVVTKKKATPIAKEDVVKSVTVRLVDIDDADFLKYACKSQGMNMQEFFWSLLENDMKSTKKIDPRDAEHIEYKTIALPEIRTIPIPKSLKEKIAIKSGQHRLPETRYMAMVVHRARLSNPAWS